MSERRDKKRSNNSTIDKYFKKLKTETESSADVTSASVSVTKPSEIQTVFQEKPVTQHLVLECEKENEENNVQYDIGCFITKINEIDDFTRYQLLVNHWVPEKDYSFPFSVHTKRGREEKRHVNHGHLDNYEWLVFSKNGEGLFCKYCALFLSNKQVGGQKTVLPKKLVTEPLNKYAKLTGKEGDLNHHQTTNYHSQAVERGKLCFDNI